MEELAAKPRGRLQLSLRTLLLVAATAGVAAWLYWYAVPWWRIYREQMQFEESVKSLKAGMTPNAASHLVRGNRKSWTSTVASDRKGNPIVLVHYPWPNAIYFIYYVLPGSIRGANSGERPCASVEVFRLPPVPRDYKAQTKGGRDHVSRRVPPPAADEVSWVGYIADFLDIISGDRKDDHGLTYKLIYSDPHEE